MIRPRRTPVSLEAQMQSDRTEKRGENDSAPLRQRSAPHPRYSLYAAETLARSIIKIGGRNCDQDAAAQEANYKSAKNGSFKGLRAAALYFGLVSYPDEHFISVTESWIQAIHRDDEESLRAVRARSVVLPDLYKQLFDEYEGKQLPAVEKLAEKLFLTPKFGILPDAAHTAASVFIESVDFAGLLDDKRFLLTPVVGSSQGDARRDGDHSIARTSANVSPEAPQRQAVKPSGISEHHEVDSPRSENRDRFKILLASSRAAILDLPVPLSAKEKERLKAYIDLVLEPEETERLPDHEWSDSRSSD